MGFSYSDTASLQCLPFEIIFFFKNALSKLQIIRRLVRE